ncbi:hypothetical protein [Thermobifida cellulosilytica]|uniref:Uncharacterized protein n=1 Tax=Thermobifida cellulosilytica TB100 TaxID=665004 RepID=A0A147KGM0_THECS|nr:hypothetical protein [Thermobifida cellulosilytica]KUP96433.1 hypothetical protein AC529_11745 [Thermobifida cellulosilytica TB100]
MMALLRSRRVQVGLAVAGVLALLGTTAVTLLYRPWTSESAPAAPAAAPPLEALGAAPEGVAYTDLGEQCTQDECYRAVAVTADGLDAEGAIDAVYTHLIDQGWGRMLPEGESDLDEVPYAESALTDGSVMVQGSLAPYVEGTTAGLLLAHLVPPSPAS